MFEKDRKRIGIFEYDWLIYHYTKDFAIKLAEAGYSVDYFYKHSIIRNNYTDTKDFNLYENIRLFDYTKPATGRQVFMRRYNRLLNKIAILFSFPRKERPEEIIDCDTLNKSIETIKTSQYYCFIGIEKKGLVWAGMLSEMYCCPLVYFSLELFTEDNPVLDRVYHLLDAERKYHKQAAATIIQDGLRADALLRSNGIGRTNVLHFPVSAKGNIVRAKSKFLQNKLHIDHNKKIILYFGLIDKSRFVTEIVKVAKNLDDGTVLVVHGTGPKRYLDYLQSIADENKVVFSLDFVPEQEIENMISSADIGIALYKATNANDRLVAFSASKIAYYTQCGIPMIAFDTESFRELVSNYRCAELITNIDEIPYKARKILENYDLYRQQAFSAFRTFYNLDENFSKLIKNLELIVDGVHPVIDKDNVGSI